MGEIKVAVSCRSLEDLVLKVTPAEREALGKMNKAELRVALAKLVAEYQEDEREGRWTERDGLFLGPESVNSFGVPYEHEAHREFSDKDGLLQLPPKDRTIIPPAEGWEQNAYYSVAVSMHPKNPIFSAIFFSGFLNVMDGSPGGYNCLFNPTMEGEQPSINQFHYLRVIRRLNHEVFCS